MRFAILQRLLRQHCCSLLTLAPQRVGEGGGGSKENMTEKTGEKKSKSEKLFLLTQTSLFAASSTTGAQPARHRMPLEMRPAVLVSPTLHINQHLIKGK